VAVSSDGSAPVDAQPVSQTSAASRPLYHYDLEVKRVAREGRAHLVQPSGMPRGSAPAAPLPAACPTILCPGAPCAARQPDAEARRTAEISARRRCLLSPSLASRTPLGLRRRLPVLAHRANAHCLAPRRGKAPRPKVAGAPKEGLRRHNTPPGSKNECSLGRLGSLRDSRASTPRHTSAAGRAPLRKAPPPLFRSGGG
jgi:hypothetical protein